MISLLLIEDDIQLGKTLSAQLIANQYNVCWCQSVKDFAKQKDKNFDLAIVDLNLPDGSGFDIIRQLQSPVIIMTAQNTPENRLQGLEQGVYDFIPKPFLFKELHLKVDRLLAQREQSIHLESGVIIDLKSRTVEDINGGLTFLNEREFYILKMLIENAPQVLSRDVILDDLREDDNASHRSIDNVIVRLRQILMDEQHRTINSVRGVGYQWVGVKK